SLVSHAAALLLVDAPRAASMALGRAMAGRDEPVEQLSLALGVLALGDDGRLRPSLELGRAGDGGAIVPVQVTNLKGTPERVTEFTLDGHVISLGHDDAGAVTHVERDGKPPSLASLPFARTPTAGGESWMSPGRGRAKPVVLARLFGAPEVGFTDDTRFLVRGGSKPKGRDAVAAPAPGPDARVEADLKPGDRAPVLVVLRASATPTGFAGVALVLDPGEPKTASIVALDGSGGRIPIAGPVPVPRSATRVVHVRAEVSHDHVEATVGGQSLAGQLPDPAASARGDVAFAPGDRNELEVKNLKIGAARRR
ncbi:MAG TPA: hypothetical protein VHB21_21410, partial [Minicystis sp.]|nr:hypothetical protein [Minicystis sp.]